MSVIAVAQEASVGCSVDARGEEEVLQDRHDPDHAQVREQLVVFFLALAILYQVGAEDEDGCAEDGQHFERLEAEDAIPQQIDLKKG